MTPMKSPVLWPAGRSASVCGPVRWRGMPRGRPRGIPTASVLRVELDDQLLGEDRVDLLTDGQRVDHDLQRARDDLHPGRGGALAEGLASQLDREGVHGLGANGDDVVLLDAVGRDVHPHAVDLEVAVRDELASRTT